MVNANLLPVLAWLTCGAFSALVTSKAIGEIARRDVQIEPGMATFILVVLGPVGLVSIAYSILVGWHRTQLEKRARRRMECYFDRRSRSRGVRRSG